MITFSSFDSLTHWMDVSHPSETGNSTCMLLKLFQYAQVDVKAIDPLNAVPHNYHLRTLLC